ncbi:MAG TPA: Mut7-C RNAse domain-containing protein [Syntrophales bacterium]|nr:Mut7-C RNAse domain-containing protein [Syntrophales bacterium]
MKFITDANLGKLAKWLRILGYNTVFYTGDADHNFLRKAEDEGRVALTRKKDVEERQFSGQLVVIHNDQVQKQLEEVIDKLNLFPDSERLFSICLRCNELLIRVNKEEVSGLVPDHIYASHTEFHMCPYCRGIFWPGTHMDNARRYLRMHIQHHHL